MRSRTMFYKSLGRLLMFDLGEDEERFYTFMAPIASKFFWKENMISPKQKKPLLSDQFESLIALNDYSNQEAKKAIIGLARDLRGLAYALNSKVPYAMFFEWIYPDYTPVLLNAVEFWPLDPTVTTPVLKLFAELVNCRWQRLQGNESSPNGILLFSEASKLICIYGNRILNSSPPVHNIYPLRLKGIAVCFLILKHALSGNYVNFAVFKLYRDDTLNNVLNVTAKLILSIQQSDILVT